MLPIPLLLTHTASQTCQSIRLEPEQEEDTVEKAKEIYRSLRPVLLEAGLID